MNQFTQLEDTVLTVNTPYNYPYIDMSMLSGNVNSSSLRHIRQLASSYIALSPVIEFYSQASEECGGVVQMNTKYGCLPFMLGNDGQPVLLYEFVEVLDEYFDYDRVKAEFPTLSYGQISGAIAFLRKLAQFNTRQLNIDDLEDAELEASPEFQSLIEQSLANREVGRVLTVE